MSQSNEEKPEVKVETALPPNNVKPEELAQINKDQENKQEPPKQSIETKPAKAQEPTPETVKKVQEAVKGWQIAIVVIVVIGFSFGLILLYDKELRQKVIEALKKRFKKQ